MKRTLLIVDDIKSNREILKNMLGGDYSIIEAEHGQEALAVMTADYKQISAVLLDLVMPVMDGFEVLSYMQGNEKLSQLPVIVTTGQTDSGSEERALRLGAKDYISKPYKSAIIKQRIWNTINLRETAATINALQRDRLTGLYSRDSFYEKVRGLVSAAEPGSYVMACFDIDKFKIINDQYGAEKGDEVLCYIADVFRRGFEPNGGICCRISADNFAVLYPAPFQESSALAEMRRHAANVSGLPAPITFSIGRYIIDDLSLSPNAMYDRAKLAVESIKGRYDAKIAIYDESMRSRLLHEQELVTEMESALEGRQFEIWFQPQYNHSNKAIVGAEALVRWRHPKKGLIPPSEFVPIFEQNGFIYDLDKYVWEEACRYLRGEIDEGRSPVPVSVNVSRYDVFRLDFFGTITGLLNKYGISVELLRLEVTESAFAETAGYIFDMVKQLISYGFTVEIDDFGSGYSSLNTLKNVSAQVVKLDMRFLEDDEGSQRGGNIIESVVRMAKWLGMSVIAEGVETPAQADYLRSIGCSYIQGYLYSKPIPEEEFRNLCVNSDKQEKFFSLGTVENFDNNSFWNPDSMDTLIFNTYVGAACILEYYKGKIEMLRASKKYAAIIGGEDMTIDDVLHIGWEKYLEEESYERLIRNLERIVETGEELTDEYTFVGLPIQKSTKVCLRTSIRIIAKTGERCLVYCINENITAQKIAELHGRVISEQMKTVMDNVACGITAVSIDGEKTEYILANGKYFSILGYSEKQYQDEIGSQAFRTIYPDDKARVMKIVGQVITTGRPVTIEYRALRRNGDVVWLRSIISMAAFDNISNRVQISTYTDITLQKQAERNLRDTTAQLRNMMDDVPGGFARIQSFPDGKMKPVFLNEGFCRLTGMSHAEAFGLYQNDAFAGVHPEDVRIVKDAVSKMFGRGTGASARYRLIKKDSPEGYIWLSIFGRVTKDAEGNSFLNIYYSDATEQIKTEQQQKELLDNLPYGAALYELDGEELSVIHINKRYWELVGRSEKEYQGSSFMLAVSPDDRENVFKEMKAAIREKRDVSVDIHLLFGESDYRPFHISGRILKKNDGKYSIYASYTPISDEEISVQEMLPIVLSAMMNTQNGYSFVKDKNLRYVCASKDVAAMVGLGSPAEIVGKTDRELFSSELADAFSVDDRRVLETGESLIDNIDTIPSGDGSTHFASTSKFPLKDSKGSIIGVYGIGRDVTEARNIKSRLELITNNIPGGIAIYEGKAEDISKIRLTYFSDGFCKIFGYSRKEYEKLASINPLGLVFSEDIGKMYKKIGALVKDGVPMDYVYRAKSKNGTIKWVNARAVMGEPNGENLTVNAVFFDVTKQQDTLEQLRISEETNRLAIRHSRNIVCKYDVETRQLSVSPNVNPIFEAESVEYDIPYKVVREGKISPETAEVYTDFYEKILKGEREGEVLFQRQSTHGWRWLEAHFTSIFSDENKPVSAVVSYKDITDQLEKDFAYKKWQQSFASKSSESYSLFRCNVGKQTSFDASEGELLNIKFSSGMFSFDERTDEYIAKCVYPEDAKRFGEFLNVDSLLSGFYQGKRMVLLEYREKLPNKQYRWLRLTVDLVEHSYSPEIEAYLLFEDIDKAKRLELATIEQAETDPLTGVMNRLTFATRVNAILQTSKPGVMHAMMMLDMDGFKKVNDAFGHSAGDQALIDIANSIRSALRHGDLVGRLGGDEFLVFLTDIPTDAVAATKAKQICALARKSFSAEVEISGSVGIVLTPRDGTDYDALYKKVDAALYHVKGSGKNNFIFYHEDMADEHLVLDRKGDVINEAESLRRRRMLIVDDSRIDHAMLTNIFADQFIIEKAKDGESALIRLRHYGSAISAVLLDLMMPGMDGFTVLEKMQETEELRSIPVIVVSSDDSRETSLRAIREGAVDFVTKPVDSDILRIRVQSAISKADNERLRAKNSLLEFQNSEIARYKTALESSGIVVIEYDWVAGTFIYDSSISEHLAGKYDGRSLWHVLLSDFVAETVTVQKMQELTQIIATDRKRKNEKMLALLKTPEGNQHWFRVNVFKKVNEFGLAGKIYITLIDLGVEKPDSKE